MSKLSLKNVGETLTKNQLKQIVGGLDSYCDSNCSGPCPRGAVSGQCRVHVATKICSCALAEEQKT